MDLHVADCLVTGYEPLVPTLTLPDADDCHVLAAAIHSGAELIVTFNLSDSPASILGPLLIEAIHPDEQPDSVLDAVRLQRAGLKNPPKTAAEYLATLERCQLPETASGLKPHAGEI
jgi:hypothetical protein